jgi:(R)-amidase
VNPLRLRLVQPTLVDGDIRQNLAKILRTIRASEGLADLVVFPETSISGFPTPGNVWHLSEPVDGASINAVRHAAQQAAVSVVIGFAEAHEGHYFNAALLIDEAGRILLHYRKNCLYESDDGVFEAGTRFPVCDWRGIRIGLLICFDIEFPAPICKLARQGAELVVLVDGMMHPDGYVHRQTIPVRARDHRLFIAMANRVGEGSRYGFSGESHVADPSGKTMVLASSEDEALIDTVLDIDQVTQAHVTTRHLTGYLIDGI